MEAFEVRPARLSDVSFFVQQIVLGAQASIFSPKFLQPWYALELTRECCRGILGNFPVLRSLSGGRRFLVAKSGTATAGALLVKWGRGAEANRLLIEYLVVDPQQRRAGAGSGLLRHVLAGPKRPASVLSACSPNAKGMIALLKGFGFKRSQRSLAAAPNLVAPQLFELGLEGSGPARPKPKRGGAAPSPAVKSSGP